MKLEGNTILITGGTTGIGLAFAKKFQALGNQVIVTSRREAGLTEFRAQNPGIHTYVSDVGDPSSIIALEKQVRADHPRLNVIMNNAGIFQFKNLTAPAADLVALTAELDINTAGAIRMNSAFIDLLKTNRGTIINTSSALAYVPMAVTPIYCASKAAIHSYTVCLREQLKGSVEVVELLPPSTKTRLADDIPAEANLKFISPDQLVDAAIAGLRAGHPEIRPGQASQMYWMSRMAPGFIHGMVNKDVQKFLPPADKTSS